MLGAVLNSPRKKLIFGVLFGALLLGGVVMAVAG